MKTEHAILVTTSIIHDTPYLTAKVVGLENNKPRNLVSTVYNSPKTQYYENLAYKYHASEWDGKKEMIDHKYGYCDVLSIEEVMAVKMATTLKAIGKKMSQYEEEFGYEKDPAKNILRFAKSCGIKKVMFYMNANIASNYDNNEYRYLEGASARYAIEKMCDQMTK